MKLNYLIPIILFLFFGYGLVIYANRFTPLPSDLMIDRIVVIKHQRILQLISGDAVVKTCRVSLGRVPVGHKQFEGDCKTPEGFYVINDKSPVSAFHKNLGISYPNDKDISYAQSMGKAPGGLIKIHGLRHGLGWIGKFHLLKDWTVGCIAVTNSEIDELYERIAIGTPIEIRP